VDLRWDLILTVAEHISPQRLTKRYSASRCVVLPNKPLRDQARRLRRRGMGAWGRCLRSGSGSIPFAARGLAAVLARVDPGRAQWSTEPGP
jgi:hypothetical protein